MTPRTTDRPARPYLTPVPLALAHRGGAMLPVNVGLENTLAAFRAAVELGFRHLETDVHATRDGVLVAFHDATLDRVSDTTGAIESLTWAQVRAASIGSGHRIPTLDELLEELPDALFNIDIKAAGATRPLWETVRRHAAQERVCVGSFSDRRIREFRRLSGGSTATAAGPLETAALRLLPGPLVARLRPAYDVLQVPRTRVVAGHEVVVVTRELVERAHALGVQVHVWTIDDAAEMAELLDLGVDGIVSDRPDILRAVLTERGAWHGG